MATWLVFYVACVQIWNSDRCLHMLNSFSFNPASMAYMLPTFSFLCEIIVFLNNCAITMLTSSQARQLVISHLICLQEVMMCKQTYRSLHVPEVFSINCHSNFSCFALCSFIFILCLHPLCTDHTQHLASQEQQLWSNTEPWTEVFTLPHLFLSDSDQSLSFPIGILGIRPNSDWKICQPN